MASIINIPRLQLGLPRTCALLFAGSAFYIGFIDPQVRNSQQFEKNQLIHWSSMYNHSKWPMASLAAAASLFGANAYRLTDQPLWIYGSLAAFSIIPFTFFGIMGINKSLAQEEANSQPGSEPRKGITMKLTSWVWRHRVRVLLSLVAAGFFYAAQGKVSANDLISKA